ncbi:CsoS2 family carboxysome shell protein [Thiohalorhabdus sp. Cl-TMA]|uniref:CsoS2 family carboxysome shell protein n=1 Tax=Thiohalorhabdus methylotrophus TaxID=3242694 RepID=A0ABV4TTY2_9GAMM
MADPEQQTSRSGREAARARRRAQAGRGKADLAQKAAGSQSHSAQSAQATAQAGSRSGHGAQSGGTTAASGKEAAKARRRAMAESGKAAVNNEGRTRAKSSGGGAPEGEAAPEAGNVAKEDCGCGCRKEAEAGSGRDRGEAAEARRSSQPAGRSGRARGGSRSRRSASPAQESAARTMARAKRKAQAERGKAGDAQGNLSPAQAARHANPEMSGREVARKIREKRARQGGAGEKSSGPCGRLRGSQSSKGRGSQDAPWKVGVSETSHGQSVTGTQTGWSDHVTGEEPGSCRNITGTEYLGADIFREFCHEGPQPSVEKVGVSQTGSGRSVTGSEVGRSERVTGNEPGTCKQVTGTEYLSLDQYQSYCNTRPAPGPQKVSQAQTDHGLGVTGNLAGRSPQVTGDETGADRAITGTQYMQKGNGYAPEKVESSETLSGGTVTGSRVGRGEQVTGDEPGSCHNVTGDDYIGREQYRGYCGTDPGPQSEEKVGVSATLSGRPVSGTQTGRSARVTGDEPGTCQAVTGTPYAGAEQYRSYCDPEDTQMAAARRPSGAGTPGPSMTGQQPGVNGKMTGADDGACQKPTGTPYLGGDQYAEACPAQAAEPHSPDYPQPLDAAPWTDFSVHPPAHAADVEPEPSRVTGTSYEQGQITGAFSMAKGKVTGTEEFRHGGSRSGGSVQPASQVQPQPAPEDQAGSRVTGEGMDVGAAITGDDWNRGERVTGTEGTPARRNPSRRGQATSAMPMDWAAKRNEDVPVPESPVTGGAGTTEKGAGVTYSGGARG